MYWTLEDLDNMVNGLFFCHSQAAEGAIPHLCKQERKSDTGAEADKAEPTLFLAEPFRESGFRLCVVQP